MQFQSNAKISVERSKCSSSMLAQATQNTRQPLNSFIDSQTAAASPFKLPNELNEFKTKELVKENNLVTCLYYNLACCYQRLGLLEEAVEYLELSSNQLEETIDFYTKQESALISLK